MPISTKRSRAAQNHNHHFPAHVPESDRSAIAAATCSLHRHRILASAELAKMPTCCRKVMMRWRSNNLATIRMRRFGASGDSNARAHRARIQQLNQRRRKPERPEAALRERSGVLQLLPYPRMRRWCGGGGAIQACWRQRGWIYIRPSWPWVTRSRNFDQPCHRMRDCSPVVVRSTARTALTIICRPWLEPYSAISSPGCGPELLLVHSDNTRPASSWR